MTDITTDPDLAMMNEAARRSAEQLNAVYNSKPKADLAPMDLLQPGEEQVSVYVPLKLVRYPYQSHVGFKVDLGHGTIVHVQPGAQPMPRRFAELEQCRLAGVRICDSWQDAMAAANRDQAAKAKFEKAAAIAWQKAQHAVSQGQPSN